MLALTLVSAGVKADPNNAKASSPSPTPDKHAAKKQQPSNENTSKAAGLDASSNNNHAAQAPMTYARLKKQAQKRASQDYKPPGKVPEALSNLSRDDYARISYKRQAALWRDKPSSGYRLMGYLPGSFYTHSVAIDVIDTHHTQPFSFAKANFDFDGQKLASAVPDDLGYAGFKVLHELNQPGKLDEVLSFLGASYFRAVGGNEHFGLSARGLAINTANANGETFPNFVHFWVKRPTASTRSLTIFALLTAPELTGAYRFVVTPGGATYVHVDSTLFTRKTVDKLGVAPLTSMFTWGENSLARRGSLRPEAHDSDGLLVHRGDDGWQWQPLVNPQKLAMSDIDADDVRGFGLFQRDRHYSHYLAIDKAYQRRPNLWITPEGDWGKGHIELIEIPSKREANDNIEVAWIPDQPVKAGQTLSFSYDMKWSGQPAQPPLIARVESSHVGYVSDGAHDRIRLALEFAGGSLDDIGIDKLSPQVTTLRKVDIADVRLRRDPHLNSWRLTFTVPDGAIAKPLGLRVYLKNDEGKPVSETWRYSLSAP